MIDREAFRGKGPAGWLIAALAIALTGCQLLPGGSPALTGDRTLGGGLTSTAAKPSAVNAATMSDAERLAKFGPTRAEALAKEKPLALKASTGGQYVSADGLLKVTIPPGVLSKDTQVRFARVETSHVSETAFTTPGIMFAVDLGGAFVLDNQSITVTAAADPRLLEQAQKRIPNFKPEMMNMTLGADGKYYMTMPVRGNVSAPPPASPRGANWELMEFGPRVGVNAPVGPRLPAESRKYKVQQAAALQKQTGRRGTFADSNWPAGTVEISNKNRPASWPSLTDAKWVWDTDNLDNGGTYSAKTTFDVHPQATSIVGTVNFAADGEGDLYINGTLVASATTSINTVAVDSYLVPGTNVLEVQARNPAASGAVTFQDNPAGVLARIDYEWMEPSDRVVPINSGFATIDNMDPMLVVDYNDNQGQTKWPIVKTIKFWDGRDIALMGPGATPYSYPYTVYNADAPQPGMPTTLTTINETLKATYNGYGEFFECLGIWHSNCSVSVVDEILGAVMIYNQAVLHLREPEPSLVSKVQGYTNTVNCSNQYTSLFQVNMVFDSDNPAAVGPIDGANWNGQVTFGQGSAIVTMPTDNTGFAGQSYSDKTTAVITASFDNTRLQQEDGTFIPAPDPSAYLTPELEVKEPDSVGLSPVGTNTAVGSKVINDKDPATLRYVVKFWRNSPEISLPFTSEAPVTSAPVVRFTMDGQSFKVSTNPVATDPSELPFKSINLAADKKSGTLIFHATVKDDLPNHSFKLEGVSAGDEIVAVDLPQTPLPTQRTKKYNIPLKLIFIGAK